MHPALWIISCHSDSSDTVRREIEGRCDHTPESLRWHVSADFSLSEMPRLFLSQLCCVIAVVDREALSSAKFMEAIHLPIAAMYDREYLAVFPWLKDVSLDEFKALAEQGNPLATAFVENIHLDPSMESLDALIGMICLHVENHAKVLRTLGLFQRLSVAVTREIGRMASIASLLIILHALWTAMIVFVILRGTIVDRIPFHFPPAPQQGQFPISAVLALASIPIAFFRFQCLDDLRKCGPNLARDYSPLAVEMLAVEGGGIAIGLSAFFLAWNCDAKAIIFGVGLGIMLVALSRKGSRSRVHSIPFADFPKILPHGLLLSWLYGRMAGAVVNTGRPLFEPFHKRVFISYARSSPWSVGVAEKAIDRLRKTGAFVFQDRFSLQPGRSWKGQLRSAICNSNVFVIVLDGKCSHREWIAAEFAAAFWIKMVKRTPEIFVIHPPGVNFSDLTTPAGAFFKELLVEPSRPIPEWMRSHMGACDADNFARMCSDIRDYRITGPFGFLGNRILFQVLRVVVPLCVIAQMLSIPVLLGIALKREALANHVAFAALLSLASSFLCGFSIRDALFLVVEGIERKDFSHWPGLMGLLITIVFVSLVAICLPLLGLMDLLLLVPALFLGWECASFVAIATRTWKQSGIIK
jgi:hypothetical protein